MRRSASDNFVQLVNITMRGGLVHHTIMIPAALSLPLLRGACSMSFTYNIQNDGFIPESPIFPVSNFFDC